MKSLKKRKTSKGTKSRQRKPKVYSATKKRNSKKESCKDGFIDITCELSPYSVFIALIVMKDYKPLMLIKFESERNATRLLFDLTKDRMSQSDDHIWNVHTRLAEILTNRDEPSDYLSTIIENFLACFTDSKAILEEYPDQSLGYILRFDVDDLTKCDLIGSTKTDVEELFYAIIGDPNMTTMNKQSA